MHKKYQIIEKSIVLNLMPLPIIIIRMIFLGNGTKVGLRIEIEIIQASTALF